ICPCGMRSLFRGNDGSPPCTPQRKERIHEAVSQGEPGMGRDGEGRYRRDDFPSAPGRALRRRDRYTPPGRVRRPERTTRDRTQLAGDPAVERRQVRSAGGPCGPDSTGSEPPDAPEGTREGPEQQAGAATHRIEDPASLAVLQGPWRHPGRVGILAQDRGTPSEVGGAMVKRLEDLAPQGPLERAREAAGLVDRVSRVRVFCHYDPDGTTSASILTRALMRRGKRIHATMAHALDRSSAARLNEETNELLIVSDMGSAQLDLLEGLSYPVIVLDHHKPIRDSDKVAHVNPHFEGVDGAREMCGATTTWLFTLVLDEANWDLAGPAMAGAIGDKQAVGGFVGGNAALFGEAVERKVGVPERRLARLDQALGKALAQSIEPYFRGLSGRFEAAVEFLRAAGFDSEAMVRQLDAPTRRKLGSVLATRLIEQGAAPEALEALVEDRYWIEPDQMYAQDLEAYVNSCDRLGQEGLGLAVCLGDGDALTRAEKLLEEYTARLLGYLVGLEAKGLFAQRHIQFFYCDDASLAGSVAGTGMQFFFDQSKPVLGLSVLDGVTKVSARGTRSLVAAGLDLATALREAASEVDGNGGGHNVASGATVPKGKEEKFLLLVDEIVARQLAAASEKAQ